MSRITRVLFCSLAIFFYCLSTSFLRAAVPPVFTYQGAIKQNGVPVNGTYSIELRIVNSDGSQLYWTSGAQAVTVQEGLYRMELAPSGVDWSSLDTYIETKVNGTLFLPREKMTSAPFAFISNELSTCAVARGNLDVKGGLGVEGNFAVGASSPLATAEVLIKSPSVGNNTLLQLSNNANNANWKVNYTDADGSLSFTPSSASSPLKFNNNVAIQNNVGVGTAAVSNAKVYVRSPASGDNTLVQLSNSVNSANWKFNYMDADGALKLSPSSTAAPLKLNSKVSVGAGAAAPSESLDVAGNIRVTGMLKSEQNKPAFFLTVVQDVCGNPRPYLGCPTGYSLAGTWYTGGGQCTSLNYGQGYENGWVSYGWMGLCVAQ